MRVGGKLIPYLFYVETTHDYDSGSLDSKVYNPFIHSLNKCFVVAFFFFFLSANHTCQALF